MSTETFQEYTARLLALSAGSDPLEVLASTPAAVARLIAGRAPASLQRSPAPGRWSVAQIVRGAADAGVGTMIVLDLARVGSAAGVDLEAMAAVRRAVPDVALFAGGGVRSEEDLALLARAGCDGALVATALLSGALRLT